MFKVVSDDCDRNFDRNSPRTGVLVRSKVGVGLCVRYEVVLARGDLSDENA